MYRPVSAVSEAAGSGDHRRWAVNVRSHVHR